MSSSTPYESMNVTFQAFMLLVVALTALLGTVILAPEWTVRIVVAMTAIMGVLIIRLTLKPKA